MNKDGFMTVNEVAKLCGISVRALHYYDEIGLLVPDAFSDSNYRLYSNKDIDRLFQIIFLKEIGFELKKIKEILSDPNYNHEEALKNHKKILMIKKKRIEELIEIVDKTIEGQDFCYTPFDNSEIIKIQIQYYKEAGLRFKNTPEFQEFEERNETNKLSKWNEFDKKAKIIFSELSELINNQPDSDEVQFIISKWQDCISENYYQCSKEMLKSLSEMYIGDNRFVDYYNNICNGLAQFVYEAIQVYCKE